MTFGPSVTTQGRVLAEITPHDVTYDLIVGHFSSDWTKLLLRHHAAVIPAASTERVHGPDRRASTRRDSSARFVLRLFLLLLFF